MLVRYFHVCETFSYQAFLEILLHLILAMHQKYLFYLARILAGKPLAEILIVAVCAKAGDLCNFRFYKVWFAKNGHFHWFPFQSSAQRLWFAIAGK